MKRERPTSIVAVIPTPHRARLSGVLAARPSFAAAIVE